MTKISGLITRTFEKRNPIGKIIVDEKTIEEYNKKITPSSITSPLSLIKNSVVDIYQTIKQNITNFYE